MKLWIKFSIFLIIIINLVIQTLLLVILPKIKANSYELIGEKLKSLAVAASLTISGDEYENLNFGDPEVINSNSFYKYFNNPIFFSTDK